MNREYVIALAEKAGLFIHQGTQDRLLFDTPIVDALTKFADLVKGEYATVRFSFEDAEKPEIELRLPSQYELAVTDAIKLAFNMGCNIGERKYKGSLIEMIKPSPSI